MKSYNFVINYYSYQWKIPFTFKTSKDVDFNVTNSDVHWIMSPELGKGQFSSPVNKILQKQPRMFCYKI